MNMPRNWVGEQSNADRDEDEIDLREYWRVISKHRKSIIGLTLAISLVTLLVVFALTPIYRSTATVLIEADTAKVVSIDEVYELGGAAQREYFQTQFEILKSRDLAERVVTRLSLKNHPEFDPNRDDARFSLDWRRFVPESFRPEEVPPTEMEIQDAIVRDFQSRLTISPVRNSQLVRISFESSDAELAANVPNVLAEVYIESDLEARLNMTRKAASWLTGQLEGLRERQDLSEKELQEYRDREQLVDVAGVRSLAAKQLDELTQDLAEASKERSKAQSIYQQVLDQDRRGESSYESIPAVLEHPLVNRLKEVEAEAELKVFELSKRYGPEHPKMIGAQSELTATKEATQKQVRAVVDRIAREYKLSVANEREIKRALEEAKQEVREINRKEYQLGTLTRDVAANRELYDMFLKRIKETDLSSDLQSPVARIVDPSVVSLIPYKPKKRQILLLATVAGLFVGVMLAFLMEYLDNTFKTTEDVDSILGLPVLGILPQLKNNGKKKRTRSKQEEDEIHSPDHMFLEAPKSNFAESIRTIRTGVMLSSLDEDHKVVLVTSSVPSEGKSTVSMNLAIALGHLENVLLIDADMRRPSIVKFLGLPASTPGLSNLVAGSATFEECVQQIEGSEIDFLTSGVVPPNPLELLSSERFKEVLAKLSQKYDRIVIDSAPANAVSDALLLSSQASAVIYVIKADATPHQVALSGVSRLRRVNAHIVGAVLNRVDLEKASNYYGKYGYGKYGYYGYYGYGQGYQSEHAQDHSDAA